MRQQADGPSALVRAAWRVRCFFKAVWLWICLKGWHMDLSPPLAARGDATSSGTTQAAPGSESWYVTEKDLAFFKYNALGSGDRQGARPWELMMDKEVPGVLKYIAWRRVLPDGKTEYKSVTVSHDATAQEHMDMCFDDNFRPSWDGMITEHHVAEHGLFAQRQQVVRWTRRFPFAFLGDRRYTIARRQYKEGSDLYGLTKGVPDHPSAVVDTGVVNIDAFYSMWRSRTIECPWGSGKPAVEILLLHHEQMKIPENLARFAVKHGMWGFIRNMSRMMPKFTAARRSRGVSPHEADPAAYGAGFAPNPPMSRASTSSLSSMSGSSDDASECGSPRSGRCARAGFGRKLAGLAAFALFGGVALLVGGRVDGDSMRSKDARRTGVISRSASVASGLRDRRRIRRFAAEGFTD